MCMLSMLRFLCIHNNFPRGKSQGGQNETISFSFFPFAWVKGSFLSTSGTPSLWCTAVRKDGRLAALRTSCTEPGQHLCMERGKREGHHGCTWINNLPLFSLPCLNLLLQFLICLLWIPCQKLVPIKGAAAEFCVRCVCIAEYVKVLLVLQYLGSGVILW